jgi:hypothetical protein
MTFAAQEIRTKNPPAQHCAHRRSCGADGFYSATVLLLFTFLYSTAAAAVLAALAAPQQQLLQQYWQEAY